jgi:hypothetical protein
MKKTETVSLQKLLPLTEAETQSFFILLKVILDISAACKPSSSDPCCF